MSNVLVTVIVPCFNAAAWLDETLDCLRRQTHSNLEILAIDDGSTDATWEILQRNADPRLKSVRQSNQGASAARNLGLESTMGDYVQFLDADDVMGPAKIEEQIRAAEEMGPEWIIAAHWGRFRARVEDTQWEPLWSPLRQRGIDWLIHAWSRGVMMPPHGWLISRSLAERIGPWNPRAGINDDGEYFCRALIHAEGAIQVPAARVHYRSGNASLSQRTDPWAWESLLNSYELCAGHMLAAQDSPEARKSIAARLQGFQYTVYPQFPDLVSRVDSIIDTLGLPRGIPHGGGDASKLASRLLGWRLTRRLARLVRGPVKT